MFRHSPFSITTSFSRLVIDEWKVFKIEEILNLFFPAANHIVDVVSDCLPKFKVIFIWFDINYIAAQNLRK